eukprot:3937469-Rhodomonas_salina.2
MIRKNPARSRLSTRAPPARARKVLALQDSMCDNQLRSLPVLRVRKSLAALEESASQNQDPGLQCTASEGLLRLCELLDALFHLFLRAARVVRRPRRRQPGPCSIAHHDQTTRSAGKTRKRWAVDPRVAFQANADRKSKAPHL